MEEIIQKEADLRYKHPQIDNIQAAKHQAFCEGAKWMIEYMEKNRLDACDNMTEAEYERESEFVEAFIKKNKRTPTFSDAIEITRKEQKALDISICCAILDSMGYSYLMESVAKKMEHYQ